MLLVLSASGATQGDSRSTSGAVDLLLGLGLFALATWAWRRRAHPPREPKPGDGGGRIARLSDRAATSVKWAFVLGFLMYVFSPGYLGAIKLIADSGGTTAGQVLAVLICAVCTLLLIEIPAAVLFVRPDRVKATLERFRDWLSTHSWTLVAVLAGAAGVWLLLKAISDLS